MTNLFIDKPRVERSRRSAKPSSTQVSVFVEDNEDGTISVLNADGSTLDVTAASGAYAPGAPVIVTRDAAGHAISAAPSGDLSDVDADSVVLVGGTTQLLADAVDQVAGEQAYTSDQVDSVVTDWIPWAEAEMDAMSGETADALAEARQELDATQARLDDPVTGLDAAQAKADDAAASAALAQGSIPFIQQATPSAVVVGQLWFPTDPSGRVIGMKVSTATGTGGWQDYRLVAGQILVPGTVGTTEIGPDGVTAPNIKASSELSAKVASFLEVTTGMLTAGGAKITGELLADILKVATRIVAGNPSGTRSEMDPFGFHVYRKNLDGNVLEAMRFGQDEDSDFLQLNGSDGSSIASIDDSGGAAFQSVDSGDSLLYQGQEMAEYLDDYSKVVARSEVQNLPGFTIAQARSRGLVEMSFTAEIGHVYRLDTDPLRVDIGAFAGTGYVVWRLRYTTGDTALSLDSPELVQFAVKQNSGDPADTITVQLSRSNVQFDDSLFDENGELNVNILLDVTTGGPTVAHNSATPGRVTITDLGLDVDNTGSASTLLNAAPSGGGSGDGETNTTTQATKKTYTKTYAATWGQSYKIDGSITNGMDPYVVQGSGGGPARMGMIGFPALANILSGATVKKVEIYVYFKHWYNYSGGTMGLGTHGQLNKPSTYSGTTAGITKHVSNPGGVWVTLSSSGYASWKSGATRGVTLRAPNDSTLYEYYGYADWTRCKIRLTYVK